MQTVDFSTVLRGVWSLWDGTDLSDLPSDDFKNLRTWASRKLQTAWEFQLWPDLIHIEQRKFRKAYAAGTAYVAGNEVYYPPERKYYQALKATTGNAPTNLAYWAESHTSYSADDYSSSKAYVAGAMVYYPTDGNFYQCHTASTNNAPTDTSYWGVLTPFNPYVGYTQTGETALGDVLAVTEADPRITHNPKRVAFSLSRDGVQVLGATPTVWVTFRRRVPKLTGEVFSTTTAYTVGTQVYFTASTGLGNFYDCIVATSAGESPDSASSKWSVVELPLYFEGFLVHATLAQAYKSDGQNDRSLLEEETAITLLGDKAGVLAGQSGQVPRPEVFSR